MHTHAANAQVKQQLSQSRMWLHSSLHTRVFTYRLYNEKRYIQKFMGMKMSPFYIILFFFFFVRGSRSWIYFKLFSQGTSSPHPFFRSLTKNNLKLDMTFGIVYTTKHDITNRLINRWTFPPLITIQYIRWMQNWQAFQMDGVNCRAYKFLRNSVAL